MVEKNPVLLSIFCLSGFDFGKLMSRPKKLRMLLLKRGIIFYSNDASPIQKRKNTNWFSSFEMKPATNKQFPKSSKTKPK